MIFLGKFEEMIIPVILTWLQCNGLFFPTRYVRFFEKRLM